MKSVALLTLTLLTSLLCICQVTSVTQLQDAKPGAGYYESLKYLVEDLGCVNGDSDRYFRPDKPITKGYWAIVTNATFDRLNDLIGASGYEIKDSVKRDKFLIEMLSTIPNGLCNIKDVRIVSVSQLKDINEKADYFYATQSLIERWGLVWLKTPTTLAPNEPIKEAEFQKFFTYAFKASFETAAKGFLKRGDFIQYIAAWVKHFIEIKQNKIEEANK